MNIDNQPSKEALSNLRMLAAGLELVRKELGGHPLQIDSGFRCLQLNRVIGSKDTSAHVLGYAADLKCPGFGTPLQIAKKLAESTIKFDQVINEGTWVHISIDPRNRRELLTAHFNGGRATYTEGL